MIDPSTLSTREVYRLLISCVVPRPIALVTSLSAKGVINAAPFSFFNAVSASPPVLMISVGRRKGMVKDTAANILSSKEFVVHIVDETMAERMNMTSASLPPDESEIVPAGFTLIPSEKVFVPRIAESPIQMECRLIQRAEVEISSVDLLLGEVIAIHIREDLLQDGNVNAQKLRAIGRMGGNSYCRTSDLFEMFRPQ